MNLKNINLNINENNDYNNPLDKSYEIQTDNLAQKPLIIVSKISGIVFYKWLQRKNYDNKTLNRNIIEIFVKGFLSQFPEDIKIDLIKNLKNIINNL